ncbi:Uncharacterised protein [Pseudomonas aeruginosa]|uniref:hypothetical protein n=1 Tax=Pseudomonas aeruginosa TaxID=287 RepID=UPI00071798F5|nr:hypothetical protein [Pseudomonas aeruginosa]KRV02459.1 hypothetical protein AN455_11075 [Pseudomonas aeruginosa]KRV08266.1 hypothetical protein AN456_11905 [Pseudomonas aeruginosa]SQC54710.1 Uncharacterised protein [Pseudomonas aeruginosa]
MDRIHWFAVSNPEQKRFPEWRRSFGISDNGTVFVPAAMAGDDSELHVMLCASADGQSTTVHLDHHFVPSDWLKREFPKHFELIEIIESRAQLTLAAAFQQQEAQR